ncbi:MAG: dephospho-CoA kinase, partial [Acholeplasmataceae bacterium]
LMKRDHITKNEAIKRIDSQLPIEEKVSRSDYVIDNSKTVSHTLKQVQHVLKELEKEYGNL